MGCEESQLFNQDLIRHSTRSKAFIKTENLGKQRLKTDTGELPPLLTQGQFSITDEDIDMIEGLLQSHHLFYKVRTFGGRAIVTKLQKFTVSLGEAIFRKGDISDYFYIIVEGRVTITNFAPKLEQKILTRGECFGDLGIENKASRSGSATAMTDMKLLGLRRSHFLRVSLQLSRRAQNEVFKEIKCVQAFSFLNMHQKHKISYIAQQLRFPKGAYIFRRGENSDCLFVIRSGKVRLDVPNKESIEITSRQSFGESCLREERNLRAADAVCTENSVLLGFSKCDMVKHLGSSLQQIEITNKVLWALKRQPNLKVSPIILDAIIESKHVAFFKEGEAVARKGDPINHFIISLEGTINNSKQLEMLNWNYVNDLKHQTEDLVKKGDGMVALISIQEIQRKFNRSLDLLLNIDRMIYKEIESSMVLEEYTKSINLLQLQIVQILGEGHYGATLKVKTDSNVQFALKIFQKAKILQENAQDCVMMLKRIDSMIAHSLIAKSYRIASDQSRVYFLNRLVRGEPLSHCLMEQGRLPLQTVRHFSACMINILEYLHCKRILWREMKLESFVIDQDGYLNLVDLMYLQQLKEEEFFIDAQTMATLYYLSPETLSGQGYGMQSDFWALGVIIYRMLVGQFPFGQQMSPEDPTVLGVFSDQINVTGLRLPQWLPSDAKMLLKLLLNVNSLERSLISVKRLKAMTFFKDYDWLGLMERRIKNIPYYPKKPKNGTKGLSTTLSAWASGQSSSPPVNDTLDNFEYL